MADTTPTKYRQYIWDEDAYRVIVDLYIRHPGQHRKIATEASKILQSDLITQARVYRLWQDGQKDPRLPPIRETLEVLVEEERFAQEAERDELPQLVRNSARRNLRQHLDHLNGGLEFLAGRRNALFKNGELSIFNITRRFLEEIANDVATGRTHDPKTNKREPMSLETKWLWVNRFNKLARETDEAWTALMLADKTLQGAAKVTALLNVNGTIDADGQPAGQNLLDFLPNKDQPPEVRLAELKRQLDAYYELPGVRPEEITQPEQTVSIDETGSSSQDGGS